MLVNGSKIGQKKVNDHATEALENGVDHDDSDDDKEEDGGVAGGETGAGESLGRRVELSLNLI